jgi:hypothetical protein
MRFRIAGAARVRVRHVRERGTGVAEWAGPVDWSSLTHWVSLTCEPRGKMVISLSILNKNFDINPKIINNSKKIE